MFTFYKNDCQNYFLKDFFLLGHLLYTLQYNTKEKLYYGTVDTVFMLFISIKLSNKYEIVYFFIFIHVQAN